jgi:hypothetical protein
MTDRCQHDMLPGQCSSCQGVADEAIYVAAAVGADIRDHSPKPAPAPSRTLSASFASRCQGNSSYCVGWIHPGDPIAYAEHLDAWVCIQCGEAL